ncbi:response regulator protein GraR [Clostridium tepidiprofundi DSM 19306]|uniref:Stage 0 sporulation protein A homolog n=1 Tax=Clostridium tepidiprofundi DSM 19306 TaxID=1121338 RepID=A0A151B5U8_9CLOT|nr:response regulator transcription factor [Clostridium tepidiprofundi]KYH35266.1 response regulator protein GraR [Clostridium tepidiprofundi DSM 19306]
MKKIVIIEDDVFLREEIQNILEKQGYSVECISSFDNVLEDIASTSPSLIVLDLNLPKLSGFDICRALKARGICPILVLTSRNQLRDELHALDLGADDYLTKPCHPKRLIARIKKLIYLYANMHVLLDAGDFKLDENANVLYVGEKSISLSENEGIIIKALVKAAPSIVKKEEFFSLLWGSSNYVDENILQVNMTRLRKTLDKVGLCDRIKTVRGIGYQLKGGDCE